MKNHSFFLLAFTLSLTSALPGFGQKMSGQSNRAFLINNGDISISLNGIDSGSAVDRIVAYQKHRKKDIGPIQNTVWFDSETLKRIYDLLNTERMNERPVAPDSLGYTDGFRVYFASTDTTSKHSKTSIIIVSTKIAGRDAVPSGHIHKDYFCHDKTNVLFSTPKPSLNGIVKRRQWINIRGENLYNVYFNQNDNTLCSGDPHYISRYKAYKMVNQFCKDASKRRDTMVTNCEWFDFNLLKSFVLDTHSRKSGLRIYFARHTGNDNDDDKYKDAFLLIPTFRLPFLSWINSDYFDCRSTYNYFLGLQSKLNKWYTSHAMADGGDDNGEICPNHCPGTTPAP